MEKLIILMNKNDALKEKIRKLRKKYKEEKSKLLEYSHNLKKECPKIAKTIESLQKRFLA